MATHYVASDGTDTWANSTSISTPCSLATANANADPGDTVYLRGGTYNISGSGIDPANSGTDGNIITFSGYQDETVNLVGNGATCMAIDLDSDSGTIRSYIHVTKINCQDFYKHLWIRRGDYNEIDNCTFIGMYDQSSIDWYGSVMYRNAQYNHVHDCTFGEYGDHSDQSGDGVVFSIGNDDVATGDETHHNLVEDCTFYAGGHHVAGISGYNNVFRNNYVHNEAWDDVGGTLYSSRGIMMRGPSDSDAYRNLIENNRIAYAGPSANPDLIGGSGGTIASPYNIIRNNMMYQNGIYGFRISYYNVAGAPTANQNYVYNNVFWHNGWGTTETGKANWFDAYTHPTYNQDVSNFVEDNRYVNNIFNDNKCLEGDTISVIELDGTEADLQEIRDNWSDADGDPLFANVTGTPDPEQQEQFDFHLQTGSGCINAGAYLTTITTATGSGTSFVVADAGYFMDGWGIVTGDEIQIEGQSAAVTITDVNYSTDTITVDESVSWTVGDGVALPWTGSAPDLGAYQDVASGVGIDQTIKLRFSG